MMTVAELFFGNLYFKGPLKRCGLTDFPKELYEAVQRVTKQA